MKLKFIICLTIFNIVKSDSCIPQNYEVSFKSYSTTGKIIIKNAIGDPYPNLRNIDRRIKYLFNKFDIDKNNYLSYEEGKLYQEITNPTFPYMPFNAYKQLCKLLNCRAIIGLNIIDFQNTYFLYKKILNTNLNHDYEIIKNIEKNIIYKFKGVYM